MDKNLIDRFLNGSYSEEDKQLVFEWLVSNQKEHEANALLKKHWEGINKEETLVDADLRGIYDRMLDQIQEDKVVSLLSAPVHEEAKSRTMIPSFLRYAAVILITLGIGYVAWNQDGLFDQKESVATIEKTTSRGQKSHLILSDGSKVALNAESKLIYNDGYGRTNRDIELIGEAFFEVAKNAELPFNVKANNTITTALGTAFNISAYAEDVVTSISLTEGKVSISPAHVHSEPLPTVVLNPGQEFQVGSNPSAGLVRDFDMAKAISWKDNVLLFDNTNMNELIGELERWYNVKVVVLDPDKLTGVRATGKFDNESLQNVLRVLSYSLQFDYQINNDTVTINFN